jgi:DNA-binding PadR family transcriptional regulator
MVPRLSHLQFEVLDQLGGSKLSGEELRKRLATAGFAKSLAAFYQLMSRLEASDFVEGWYEQGYLGDQRYRMRHYRLTGKGVAARNDVVAHYASRVPLVPSPR